MKTYKRPPKAEVYYENKKDIKLIDEAVEHLNNLKIKDYVVTRSNFIAELSLKGAREALLLKPKSDVLPNQIPMLDVPD